MNKNIFSLVFNKALNMLVVAPEIAKGAHKSSRRKAASAAHAPLAMPKFVFALAPRALTATLAIVGASVAHGQTATVVNQGFESGTLSGWTAGGGTGTQSSSAYSAEGVGVSVVTGMTSFDSTAGQEPGEYSWTVDPYGTYMASLQATGSLSSANSFSTAATALDLSSSSTSAISSELAGTVTNAAWITQTLNLTAGETFTMAWQYISTDYEPYNDGSITSLVNTSDPSDLATVNNQTAQYALLGATNTGTGDYSTGSYGSTGWEISTYTVNETGTYVLGFASFNLSDEVNSPILFVDQAPGTTYNNGVAFDPIAPNEGTGAPTTQTTSNITTTDDAALLAANPATLLPVLDGGTLVLDGTDLTPYNFSITNNNGTVDLAGQSATISNPITDNTPGTPGSLTIANSGSGGALTLTGVNTYTGSTTINAGATLDLSGAGSIATSSGLTDNGAFNINDASGNASIANLAGNGSVYLGGNSLNITDGDGSTFSGAISGSGGLNVTGGTQALGGSNTYTGATNVASGATLAITGSGSISTSSSVNDNGTFDISGSNGDQSIVSLSGASTGTVTLGTHNLDLTDASGTFAGSIQGQGGVQVEAGTEALSGNNTYLGATVIDSGAELQLTGNGQLSSSALSSGVIANGTFDITNANGTESISTLSGNGSVTLGNNSLALTNASGTFSGVISGGGGVTIDYGAETLSGANTYQGGTDIQGGALIVSADDNLGAASGALTFGNAVLENTASFTSTRNIVVGNVANFDTDAGTTLTDTAGTITGGGLIEKQGAGTLILGADDAGSGVYVQQGTLQLTGASTYTGESNINAGATLSLTGNGSIDNSWGVVDSGGTFDISGANGNESIGTLYGSGNVNLGSNNLAFTSGETNFSGTIAGSGGIVMDGGQQTLSGSNTYAGGTTLNGGWLGVSSDANLGDTSGALNFNGGGLASTATFTSTRDINVGAAGATFDVANGTTLTDTAGAITGAGSITTVDTGTLVLGSDNASGGVNVYGGTLQLTGASAYTGATYIGDGATLSLTDNGSISNSSSVGDNGLFDISGANGNQSITGLAGSGNVDLGSNGLTFTNASNAFSGSIGGSGGVTMSGGVEVLSGNNTYMGGTTFDGGFLQVSSDANLGDASGALNFNGGTLESTASFTSTRDIDMTGAAYFDVDGGTTLTDTAGAITGSGPINKEGTGTLILGADNATGGVNVDSGTLQLTGTSTDIGAVGIANGATLALTDNGSIASASDVDNEGTFDISGANASQSIVGLSGNGSVNLGGNGLTLTNANDIYSGTINGGGGVTISGGVEALSGNNTYSGGTTFNGGTLQVGSDANLGDTTGALTFNGGTLENTASFTTARNIDVAGTATFDTDTGTVLTDTAGTITGNGTIDKQGAGTLILGTDNATGGIAVGGGTLQLNGTSAATGVVGIANGATLALNGNGSIAGASDVVNDGNFDLSNANGAQSISGLSGSGAVDLGANGLTFTNANDTYSGAIAGSGGVTMSGGVEQLSGSNTYGGGTTLNGGNLMVSSDANLGDSTGALNFNGGTLESTASFTSTRNIDMTGAANIDVDGGTTLTDTAGEITGTGPINKEGTGTLVLGSDDSTGGLTVGAGTLQLTGAGTDTGTVGVANGATLTLTGSGSVANAADVINDGTLNLGGANTSQSITSLQGNGTVALGSNGLTLTNASGIYSGTIGGSGGVTLDGGAEELSGTNSYSGGTTLNGGTLAVSSDSNLGSSTGALNFNGGTLENTASFTTTRDINATSGINIDTDTGTTLTDTAGAITGSGPINKGGDGTLVLGADNSTGGVNVGAGALQLTGVSTDTGASNIASGATLAITGNGSDASASSINNGGTLDISGANNPQSIVSLAGNGTVALGSNGLTLTNASGIYSGTIGGTGGVTMSGGAEELSGNNIYSGGTTLNGGTLAVSSDSNLGSTTGALNFNGGTLENTASFTTARDINANGAVNIVTDSGTTLTDTAGTITGSGPIDKGGSGTLVLGADNSTGGVNIGAGTLQLTGTSTDTGATNVAAGATLAITGNGSDASASSINNSGTLNIGGANGAQSIGSLAGNGTVALGNNGLTLTNANGSFSGTIGGGGGVNLSGGTEVLSGANTYTGGTTLNGGNLVVSSDANLGATGTPVTFNGGTLTVTQSITTSRNLVIDSGGAGFNTLSGVTVQDSGAISGAGGLVKSGDGTLVVSGANTFSGGTLIDGGVVQIDSGSSLGTGTILLNGGTLQTTATLNNSQNVIASGNAGVNVNAGTTTLMAGNVQAANGGGCFVKSGSGTLDFTGNEVLSNGTCVQQGMLRANGDLVSNVQVDAPGELRGVGLIQGPINVNGRLAPGNSPGTLAVTGTVTMQAGSTYEEDIDGLGTGTGAGNYSRLLISGANSQFIANGTLVPLLRGITGNASNTYVPQVGDVYQFVVAQGGIVGQFSALTQPDGLAPNTRMVAFYNVEDNHSIELGVLPDSYASLIAGSNANRNALSLAGALDKALDLQASGTASSGQSQLLFALANAKAGQLAGVLTSLSGEIYADEAAAARATGLAMQSDTLGHLMTDDSDVDAGQHGRTAWSNVSHTGNSWSGDAQGSAFQTGTNQTTAGTDLYTGNGTVVGVAVSNHDNSVNAGAEQGTIRGYDGILYGQQAVASVLIDGMVAQGHDTWITRRPDPTGVDGNLYSRASGNNTMADLTARMPMTVGGLHVEPYASVTWQQFDRGGMSETASSPAALQVAQLSASGGRALLGLNIGSEQQDPLSSEVTYRVGAALGADSRGMLSPTVQSTIEGDTFQTKAPAIGSGFVQLQANATLRLTHDAYLYGGLTDENGARRSSYGVTAGLRVSF